MVQTYRGTWAEINTDAIKRNIEQMKQHLPKSSTIMAVVKANAYGHGDVQVAKKALKFGASGLIVALLEEAMGLRESGINAPILVLGWVAPEHALVAAENNITLTFFQKEWIQEVNKITFEKNLLVHMEWDTGMGRTGLRTEKELTQIINELNKNPSIYLTGVYTHFATADEISSNYFNEQKARFESLLFLFNKLWKKHVDVHIGNSAAAIQYPKEMQHYIRTGISMYGLYPSLALKKAKGIDLKPVFSLHSRLIHVKEVFAGESISYGGTYKTKEKEWIGTIAIGYGDGWMRKLQGAFVLVDGKRLPIVGRICMDQTIIRLDKEYTLGTKVTLIGEQGNESIEMDEVASCLETINYEVPCMINDRVPRVYVENKDVN